eukprot:Skav208217  [mRNA]  locus=scaffold3686:42048:43325:- [translate_table: standard]
MSWYERNKRRKWRKIDLADSPKKSDVDEVYDGHQARRKKRLAHMRSAHGGGSREVMLSDFANVPMTSANSGPVSPKEAGYLAEPMKVFPTSTSGGGKMRSTAPVFLPMQLACIV